MASSSSSFTNFNNVQPGDLITSQAWNNVLQTLNSFNSRISALESTGPVANGVTITSVSPSGSVQVGSTIQIIGTNFGFSVGATSVTFNGTSVSSFQPGSSDTQLVVTVPNISPPQGGVVAALTVSNQVNSATVQILVLPLPQPVLGIVAVVAGQPSPLPIPVAQTAYFPFVLTSNANLPSTYTVTPTISGPPWQSLLQVLDGNKNPLANNQVPLTPNMAVTIYVSLAVPTGTTGTNFSVGVAVASGQSAGSSGLTSYTAGTTPTAPDTTIKFTFGSANPPSNVSGLAITVASGVPTTITFAMGLTVAGTYTISAALIQATNWLLTIVQPTATTSTKPAQSSVTVTSAQLPYSENVIFALEPQAGATSGQIQFTVQNTSVTGNQTQLYGLNIS